MSQRIRAVFRDGAFIPQQRCDLPEGAEVELTIDDPYTMEPQITDPGERKKALETLVRRMRENPIPENAPRFTRDELHERR
jgi:predicted DNA-binding antitoxin AbrB/MazE fold protein